MPPTYSHESLLYAIRVIDGIVNLDQLPYHYQYEVSKLLENYSDMNSKFVEILRNKINQKLGEKFASKRDEIRWIGDYGYDCANEDMVIFLAAYIKLGSDYQNWLNNGSEGDEPYTPYKVYLNRNSNEKALIIHTYSQLERIYNEVRNSQLNAYLWLSQEKEKVNEIDDFDQLMAYYKNIDNL